MLINVAGLLKSTSGCSQLERVTGKFRVDCADAECDASGTVLMIRTNEGVWASGDFTARIPLKCGKCLENFIHELNLNIEEEYFPFVDLISRKTLDVDYAEGAFRIGDDNLIDLEQAVREYSTMLAPIGPRCKEKCRGICSQCGQNLNAETCNCNYNGRDPRWGPLIELLETVREKGGN